MTMLAEPAHTAPPPRLSGRAGRWLIVGAAAWALLLAGAGYWSARHDRPTVREQRSVGQGAPVVHRAVGQLAAAAGPDAVLEIGPERLTRGCRLTTARDGATFERDIRLFTAPAVAPARLDEIAARLPEAYAAQVRHRQSHTLRADAGEFVGVRGGVTEPGVIVLTAATGCRPDEGAVGVDSLLPPPSELSAEVAAAAPALGLPAAEPDLVAVRCRGDDLAVTTRIASPTGVVPGPLRSALRDTLAGATIVHETPDLLAYRRGAVAVVVEARADRVTVSATRPCQ